MKRSLMLSAVTALIAPMTTFSAIANEPEANGSGSTLPEGIEIEVYQAPAESTANELPPQICENKKFLRVPPAPPAQCNRVSGKKHFVVVRFDIDETGATKNIQTIDSSHKCFIASAEAAVSKWRYDCSYVGRTGIETTITFERR